MILDVTTVQKSCLEPSEGECPTSEQHLEMVLLIVSQCDILISYDQLLSILLGKKLCMNRNMRKDVEGLICA